MRFVVDAHLPRGIALWLVAAGHDAVHTLDLPNGNRTGDREIIELADREGRTAVTKDSDFVTSHLLRNHPRSVLLISTGNIRNAPLEALFVPNLDAIVTALETSDLVELTKSRLIVHPDLP